MLSSPSSSSTGPSISVAPNRCPSTLLAFVVVLAVVLPACVLAPAPVAGATLGSACAGDLECEDGLSCECGICGPQGAQDEPVTCTADPRDACPEVRSDCYETCGDIDSVIGTATCPFGRELCETGQTFADCPTTICWDDAAPGEICLNGEYICENGRSQATNLCYTNGCLGAPGECVTNCNDGIVFDEQCLADAYQCEFGESIEVCGECATTDTPQCIFGCEDPRPPVASAFCVEGAWDCSAFADTIRDDTCVPPDGGLVDSGPVDGGPDAGAVDGGGTDGGNADAGDLDGGLDAGVVDAGVDGGSDAGPLDGGPQDAGADAGIGEVDAGPGPPAGIRFATASTPLSVNTCSPEIFFDVIDSQGTPSPVASPTIINFITDQATVAIYSDATCATTVTSVLLQGGSTSGSFFYRGSAVVVVNVDIAAVALTSTTQQFEIVP